MPLGCRYSKEAPSGECPYIFFILKGEEFHRGVAGVSEAHSPERLASLGTSGDENGYQ
jgi:hypothetical protein